MTQHRTASESKDSTEEAAAFREVGVTYCVNPAVKGMEPPDSHAVGDLILAHTEGLELGHRHDPVLGRC